MEEIVYTCGRIGATVDILDAIDAYLKDCNESEKKGLLQARKLVDTYGREKNKCGECFWFTKMDNRCKPYDHYCKLHYMQEIRYKDEIACSDFTEREEDDS